MAGDNLFYEFMELGKHAEKIVLNGCREHLDYFNNRSRIIQIIKYCSFRLYTHWEIFDIDGTYHICRTKWYFENDSEKFRNPVERLRYPTVILPTITCKSNILKEDLINKYIEQILKNPINPISFEKKRDFYDMRYEIIINENYIKTSDKVLLEKKYDYVDYIEIDKTAKELGIILEFIEKD